MHAREFPAPKRMMMLLEKPMSTLSITSQNIDGTVVLKLSGSAGMTQAEPMRRELQRVINARAARVVVDLTELSGISSLFAGDMVALHNALKRHGGVAIIAGPQPNVLQALSRMRIDSMMNIAKSVDEALSMA